MAKIEPANLLLKDKNGNTGLVKSLTNKDITTLKNVVTNVNYIKDFVNANGGSLPVQGDLKITATDAAGKNGKTLLGTSNGTLQWNGKNIVRSVNGALADDTGNVGVISHTIQNTNNFASKFLHNNNALKIQCVRISGKQGQQFGTINWLVPFTDTNYHVFATSEDLDENLNFQLASVTLAGKTTTSCKVGHKVEDAPTFYGGGFISVLGIGY